MEVQGNVVKMKMFCDKCELLHLIEQDLFNLQTSKLVDLFILAMLIKLPIVTLIGCIIMPLLPRE